MKRYLYLASTGVALAAAAACASSEDEPVAVDPRPDSGVSVPGDPDAGSTEDADAPTGDAEIDAGPSCSPAGWCETQLPDSNLTLRDVWAFPGSALAIASSPTVGVRVLEWRDAASAWTYIDDNTQNEGGHGQFVGKLWAANADELYFTVAPHTVFRGKRSGGAWAWTHWELESRIPFYAPAFGYPDHYKGLPRHRLAAFDIPALGVFGTSSSDVYAWFGNAIYKLSTDDAGLPTWNVEYVADDIDRPDEQLFFVAGTGTGPDDLWFAGGRTGNPNDQRTCAMAVHKTAAGYARVVDAVGVTQPFPPMPSVPPCAARPGTALIPHVASTTGWLTDIAVESASSVVALNGVSYLARIDVNGGVYSASTLKIPPSVASRPVISLWTTPTEPLWLGGTNVVARSDDAWDGGAFTISTISLNGAWLDTAMHRIRGSSNNDRWAVGARYALHKTTP
jgi:hypothetical protein